MGIRSGDHIRWRGGVAHYRRVVPPDCRAAFERVEVTKSLETRSESEARRLEKAEDVEFDSRVSAIREAKNPNRVASEFKAGMKLAEGQVTGHVDIIRRLRASGMDADDEKAAREIVLNHLHDLFGQQEELRALFGDIGNLFTDHVDTETFQRLRETLLAVTRQHLGLASPAFLSPSPLVTTGRTGVSTATLDWAWERWLAAGEGDRASSSIAAAERHYKAFRAHAKVAMLGDIRRLHVVEWRDSFVRAGKHKPKSINQRIALVSAILRAGWRDAEMSQPDLKAITLAEPDDSGRGAWKRDDILKALTELKPNSWQAWIYLIGLTTSVRLGEPIAAQRAWWNPIGFIELRDRALTKADKEHAMPIIECLRGPLAAYVEKRPDGFLFDAPKPKNPNTPISNVASKAINRFFGRHGINSCFHELRDTWIDEARVSPVKKEIWEIISGHSRLTVSDRYGGERPDALLAANEKICEFLTNDPEIKLAMLALVAP